MQNVFTVDLEEWFHGLTGTNRRVESWPGLESRVVGATRTLLALLQDARVRATFFVLGHVADHHPALIEEIRGAGHELGIHGYYHRFVYRQTPATFAEEIERSIVALERITGEAPQGHRAPYFSVNSQTGWAFDVLARYGLRYDSSVFPTRNMLYGFPGAPRFPYTLTVNPAPAEGRVSGIGKDTERLPDTRCLGTANPRETGTNQGGNDIIAARIRLVELPASTVRVAGINLPIAGGFYVRSLPYRVVRWAVNRLNQEGQPAILYVHPWELDLGQNYPHVTARERITHYHGRASLAGKLARLLDEFRFGPACEYVDGLDAGIAEKDVVTGGEPTVLRSAEAEIVGSTPKWDMPQ